MPNQWYALRSKPRKEDVVWRQLRLDGVEVFYPRLRVNPVNPRSKKIKPYFPGYLFVNVDLEQTGISRFQWMPHTIGLVSFGGEPAHVPENLIIELQKRVTEIAEAGGEVFDGLKVGDKVRISSGPFQGYEAIFDARVTGTERVRVLLELLTTQRRVPVELSSGSIEKKKK
jgi:transcription elongation factor/antiterminator RfaH